MDTLHLPSPDSREAALYARLESLGIAFTRFEHVPVFTVEEAGAVNAGQPGGHTKNLFLKDKKSGLWLVVLRDDFRLDLNALSRALGAPRFSFGSAELLQERLGVPAGSVTPFALINDRERQVRVVLDEAMLALRPLNFHPLRNDRTIAVAPEDLLRFIADCGHTPLVVALPEAAP
ncbi:MAG: prolyl-tRNA synthetase associated domain-containing protein [Alphaproteobacteria bacterium]|nr:prolyl-tRNA synthetase associated domain-containing protein [Alphaproteobacteria bacterium]